MLKEARLIVPMQDNDGHPSDDILSEVRSRMLDVFGGYTETVGMGGWADAGSIYREPVAIFDVAIDPFDSTKTGALLALAQHVRQQLYQEAVYLRWYDGDIQLVTV